MAVVGAFQDDAGATYAGSAYVFNATSGTLVATLIKPFPTAGDEFGNAVAISGNVAVVGANQYGRVATDAAGGAYVFTCASLVPPPTPTPIPLAVVLNPISQTAFTGQNVGFSADATGEAPINFQWFKGSQSLPSEYGNNLSLNAVTTASAGGYRFEATNANGTADSTTATLTVLDPRQPNAAEFVGSSMPPKMFSGSNLLIGVKFRNTGPVTWSAPQGYSLAATDDPSSLLGAASRFAFGDASTVIPTGGNGLATFIVSVTAPNAPGDYAFKVRMVEENVEFFGTEATITAHVVDRPNGAEDWLEFE